MSQNQGQTQKRCWNCRQQKIACDKTLPHCRNCLKKGRQCLGYGLKLSWPREGDRRRSASSRKEHYIIPIRSSEASFINTTSDDVRESQDQVLSRYDGTAFGEVWLTRRPQVNMARLDPYLASHDWSPVARLVSSSQSRDDLYGLLVRMSFQDETLPSLASRYAISALSYQHLAMDKAAVMHQTRAIRALQAAIETAAPSECMQLMAASMLLNIYETLNFDTSDLSWSIFFCGTKRIVNLVTKTDDTFFGDEALIIDWIFYHDVMYKFSIRHWREKNSDQILLASQRKVLSKAVFSPERQVIVPILGCSLELLDLLCQTIDAVYEPDDPNFQSESHLKQIRSLEIRLKYLQQRQSSLFPLDTTPQESTQETTVAELYRLATTIYLLRMAKREPDSAKSVLQAVDKAYETLNRLEHCERPWPLFVIALEARSEEHRGIMLRVLGKSVERRPLGAMALVARMVPDAWTQLDLREGGVDPSMLYGMIISRHRVPPCFT
ncbi:fungal-specific transcription factor domain-containing protein [Trichoderma longibrachiatum]